MRYCGLTLMGGLLFCCTPMEGWATDNAEVQALIEQLDDRDFARREAALEELATCGADAIDQLVAAAQKHSPEVASRAVQLLERLMDSEDVAVIDAADQALVVLTESDQPHAMALAAAALERNARIREKRAVARIRELGGQVQYGKQTNPLGQPFPNPAAADEEDTDPPTLVPRLIVLKESWRGGVAGLEHLRKLAHVSEMQLYVVKGSGVPIAEAQSLASVLPGLVVNERGAYLGVKANGIHQDRCLIESVPPDGPAAAAGLMAGDTVVSLDGQPIRKFDHLVELLTQRRAGEHVTITVYRSTGETADVDVKLDEWNLPPVASDDDLDAIFRRIPRIPPGGLPAPPQQR